jgi:hypothetical protein
MTYYGLAHADAHHNAIKGIMETPVGQVARIHH